MEANLLKKNTRQQQEPTSSLQRNSKKRASSNPDQDGSRKRRKAAQLEENQMPEFTAVDTDLIEDLPPPVATNTDRQNKFMERSLGVREMRWSTSRRDGGSHSDGKGRDNDGSDDDEDENKDEEDKDEEEKEDEGEKEDEKDEDENEPSFYDSEIPGISNWDLLGEDFEREAAALGLYFSYELTT